MYSVAILVKRVCEYLIKDLYLYRSLEESSTSYGEDNIPGLGQYDDFHTIDWQRDIARDRTRHR